MATDITPVEISNNPELLRLAEEVKATNKLRLLKRDNIPLVILTPVKKKQSSKASGVWISYRAKSGTAQLGIALVTTLVLLSFVGLTSAFAVIDRESALTSSAITPTTTPTLVLEVSETPTQPATLLNPADTPTATPPAASQLLCHA
jgi:hypothetical protein